MSCSGALPAVPLVLSLLACLVLCSSSDLCRISHTLSIHNGTGGVAVTYQSSAGASDNVTFENDSFPSVCGSNLRRCDVTNVERSGTSVLIIPVTRGAALVRYQLHNQLVSFQSQYVVPIPPELNCQLVKVINLRSSYVVVCVNMVEGFIRQLYITIDFDNLEMSQFEHLDSSSEYILNNPSTLSKVIVFENLVCASSDDLFFFLDDAFLTAFVRSGLTFTSERHDLDGFVERCTLTTRFEKISDTKLAIYCNGTTIEVDVCERTVSPDRFPIVTNIVSYDTVVRGTPYYCDNNVVFQRPDTLTLNTDEEVVIPFSGGPIVAGGCYSSGDETIFVFTTASGETNLTRLHENTTQRLATDAGFGPRPFMLHSEGVVANNGTESLTYNGTCRLDPVTTRIDHMSDFSVLLVDTEASLIPCECFPEPQAGCASNNTGPTCNVTATPSSIIQPSPSPSTIQLSSSPSTIQPSPSLMQPDSSMITPAPSMAPSRTTVAEPTALTSQGVSRIAPLASNTVSSNLPTTSGPDVVDANIVRPVSDGAIAGIVLALLVIVVVLVAISAVFCGYQWRKKPIRLSGPNLITLRSFSSNSTNPNVTPGHKETTFTKKTDTDPSHILSERTPDELAQATGTPVRSKPPTVNSGSIINPQHVSTNGNRDDGIIEYKNGMPMLITQPQAGPHSPHLSTEQSSHDLSGSEGRPGDTHPASNGTTNVPSCDKNRALVVRSTHENSISGESTTNSQEPLLGSINISDINTLEVTSEPRQESGTAPPTTRTHDTASLSVHGGGIPRGGAKYTLPKPEPPAFPGPDPPSPKPVPRAQPIQQEPEAQLSPDLLGVAPSLSHLYISTSSVPLASPVEDQQGPSAVVLVKGGVCSSSRIADYQNMPDNQDNS